MPFTNVAVAPSVLTIEPVTDSPEAATKPFPSPASSITVAVDVHAAAPQLPTLCAIQLFASTQRLVAGPELGATPSVETLTVIPWTPTADEAETVATPVVVEFTVKLH